MRFRLINFYQVLLMTVLSLIYTEVAAYQQLLPDSLKSNTATLQGKITNAENGEPVPFANVFLNNSTTGTTTDEQGMYTLPSVPMGNVELMVSYIGFMPYKRPLRIERPGMQTIHISLSPSEQVLTEVQVEAKQNKTWQKQYKRFEKNLLGQTANTPFCTILNPWILDFKEDENTLIATAKQPLEIENKALGYKLIYYLKQFELSKTGALYLGETKFEALKPESSKEDERWKKNRLEAYHGSSRHFFRSLINQTLEAEGFLAYKVEREPVETVQSMHKLFSSQVGNTLSKLVPSKVMFPGAMNFDRRMVFAGKIEFHYTKALDRNSPYKDAPHQVSRIKIRKSYIEMNTQGVVYDPSSYELTGYLVKEGVADMLPFNYTPEGSTDALTQTNGSVAANALLDTLKARLDRSLTLLNPQKVYLHLDKPFYVGGEMIWLSVYLVDALQHGLYPGSQVLYVDVISPEGQLVKQHKIKVFEGRAAGDILLPATLSTGNYRLRAYTQWMRNAHPDFFYDKPLEIYHIHDRTSPTQKAATQGNKPGVVLQFFPEGGQLVRGIASLVGFKATAPNGKGTAVKGSIVDEDGNKVISFQSNEIGMGSFPFKPLPGKKYTAICESITGSIKTPMPDILSEGIIMSASRPDSNSIQLKIMASSKHQQDDVYLVGQTRGIIYHTAEEKLKNGVVFLTVPTANFPVGICQLTLFSAKGSPLSERLVFVNHADAHLSVQVQPDKASYESRDQAQLNIAITDDTGNAEGATFSVSVLDAGQVTQDSLQSHILSYLLLTSDIRGYIENPARYFSGNQVSRPEDLDYLMLTQGWRRFNWQHILSEQETLLAFRPEKNLIISGRAITTSGKKVSPLSQHTLTLNPLDSLYSKPQEVTTAANGRFQVDTYDFIDSTRIMYQALDKKGRKINMTLQIDSLPATEITKPAYPLRELQHADKTLSYLHNARIRRNIDSTYAILDGKTLAEVVVQGKKVKQSPADLEGVNRLHGQPDDVLIIDEKFPPASNIYDMMSGRLAGVQVVRDGEQSNSYNVKIRNAASFKSSTQPLYLIDGLPMEDPDGNALMSISPLDVARIEILKGASASMYGVRGGNGVIAIYTRKGSSRPKGPSTAALKSFMLAGFQYPREFYSPVYDVEKNENIKPDHRATLYWNPLLFTDEQGKAKISFFNSDNATSMQVLIEGISASGKPFVYQLLIGRKK